MIGYAWSLMWGGVPTWVWVAVGIVLAVIAFRLLGWKGVLAVAAVTFGSAAYSAGARRGVQSEREKQRKADSDAVVVIDQQRKRAQEMPDDQLSKEVDRWSKH